MLSHLMQFLPRAPPMLFYEIHKFTALKQVCFEQDGDEYLTKHFDLRANKQAGSKHHTYRYTKGGMKPPRTWNPLLWHSMSFIAPNFPLVVVKHHLLHPRGHQRQHSSRPGSISPSALNQMFQGNSTCSYNTSYFASPIKCNSHTAPS